MKKQVSLLLIGICAMGFSMQVQGQKVLNTEWVVLEMEKEKVSVEAEKTPWIKLSEGRMSGFSGCNRMIGSYALDGNTLTFGALGGTKMLCFDAQELENKFLQTLQKTQYWKCKKGKLSLFDKDKKEIMKFKIKN